jgi:hypothetical protein
MDRREEKYGVGKTIYFILYISDGTEIKKDAFFVSGDIKIKIDSGTEANTTNLPTDNGTGYSLVLTDAELTGKVIEIFIEDQDATASWLTKVIEIRTFGNADACYVLDRSTSIPDQVYNTILTGATYNIPTSAGRRIRQATSSIIISGISPGTGNTAYRIELDTDASNLDGAYDPAVISIVSGTGAGQSRAIYEYDGTNRYAYINREWKTNPDSTSEYIISPYAGESHANEGILRSGSSTTAQLNALASAIDDVYNNQVLFISAGTGQDQAKLIQSYNGSTQTATIYGTFDIIPDETSVYAILPFVLDLSEIKGSGYTLGTDSLEAISDAISGISGGGGSSTVTITIEDELSIPIPEARVEIWNEDASVYLQGGYTNSSGIYTASRDDGTYTVKVRKAGWSFGDPFTLVVSGDTVQTYEGAGINIPPAPAADLCTVYEYCMDLDGEPLEKCTGEVIAVNPPIDTGDVTMYALERKGTYSAATGIIHWYLPREKRFRFVIYETKVDRKRNVPPDVDLIRLMDIPE